MAAPQLSDPGISGEWIPVVEARSSSRAAARRKRFQRLVTYTMAGLTAFAVLGLASFAWRRHALQADLEARPPALPAAPAPAPAAPPAPLAALDKDQASPPAPPVSDAPVAAPATPQAPAAAPVAAKAKPAVKKAPARSPFLKSLKSQPASIKRR
jgi:hypothetical protein